MHTWSKPLRKGPKGGPDGVHPMTPKWPIKESYTFLSSIQNPRISDSDPKRPKLALLGSQTTPFLDPRNTPSPKGTLWARSAI